jgi:hypothetical protein
MSGSLRDLINKIDEDIKLKELIEGKKVCICGPATTNKDSDYGYQIDSYDVVCRVNWHLTGKDGWDKNLIKDYGDRTDIIFSNVGPFYKCLFNDIVNRKDENSPYHCFKNLRYIYFIDPINLEKYLNTTKEYFKLNGDKYISEPELFLDKAKEIISDFGICNRYLQKEDNLDFMKKNMNLPVNTVEPMTSSGIHAIQCILRHNPKELFVTGMNFGNFGKGGKQEDLYSNGSIQWKYIPPEKYKNKIYRIHTFPITLHFFKKLLEEYPNIKLDKLLNNFYNLK